MAGAIDIVCNLFTPDDAGNLGFDEAFMEQIGIPPAIRGGVPMEDYVARMDRADVERSLLVAARTGDPQISWASYVSEERVAALCARWPDRFSGLAGIEPAMGMAGVRALERAVRDYGFVGAHWYPHRSRMAPGAAQAYPFYAKCCELGVPIMLQVGQNLIYRQGVGLPSLARPITLDRVALDFPELTLIGIHLGIPWIDEMVAMAWKHPHVFMGLDAYGPVHWTAALDRFVRGQGRSKVLFGTDWPVLDPEALIPELRALDLPDDVWSLMTRENARRLFRLP